MSKIFNPDNGFFTFMGKLWDLIWVSLLWSITSLGIITIGPATSALYYTVVKVIRRSRGYATKSFFHAFKDNFKQGAIVSGVGVVLGVILYVDLRYAMYLRETGSTAGTVFLLIFACLAMMGCFILVWIFPILSRFRVTTKQLLLDAVLISIKHFPSTLLMIAGYAGIIYLIYTYLIYIIVYGIFIIIPVLLPGLVAFLRSFLVERILKKYTPEAEGTPEETGEDQWYLE